MCGIFGYHGRCPPDPTWLSAAAAAAGRRGPHGCGWAVRTPHLRTEHHPGPLADQLAVITDLTATSILGHARLATVGDWRRIDQLQPIRVGEYAIAHNGVIRNPDELAAGHVTDSTALAHAYRNLRDEGLHPGIVLDKLVATADQQAWAIVAQDVDGSLYAHRRYHPLWRLEHDHGIYLSSQQFHPRAELLPEDLAIPL